MPKMNTELANILLQTIHSVDVNHEHQQVRSWNDTYNVNTLTTFEITCLIPMNEMQGEELYLFELFQKWLHNPTTKFDVGKYKGVFPIAYDHVISPTSFGSELRVRFTCDYIDVDEVDEMPQKASVSAIIDRLKGKNKPKKIDHFEDEDMFEV